MGDTANAIIAQDNGPPIKAEEVGEAAAINAKPKIKNAQNAVEASTVNIEPAVEDIANSLSGRAGSVSVKSEPNDKVQIIKAPSRATSGKPKAVRPRKKVTVSKFTKVSKHLQTPVQKDPGVLIDCTIFAQDGPANVRPIQMILDRFIGCYTVC